MLQVHKVYQAFEDYGDLRDQLVQWGIKEIQVFLGHLVPVAHQDPEVCEGLEVFQVFQDQKVQTDVQDLWVLKVKEVANESFKLTLGNKGTPEYIATIN